MDPNSYYYSATPQSNNGSGYNYSNAGHSRGYSQSSSQVAIPTLPPPRESNVIFLVNSQSKGVQDSFISTRDPSMPSYRVTTSEHEQLSVVTNCLNGEETAAVQWNGSGGTIVEIRNCLETTYSKTWLALSPDRSSRIMEIKKRRYHWVPRGDDICLYPLCYAPNTQPLAKITRLRRNSQGAIIELNMSTMAIALGLLEPCITATVLMQSGRVID